MKFINTITNFILIISIYLTTVNSSNCECDSTDDLKQSNISTIDIICEENECNIDGQDNILSNDKTLKISSAGTYRIQGELNGQILVEASEEDSINIILDGIIIKSTSGSTILIAGAKKVILTLERKNYLYDNLNNPNGATIYSLSNLTINGSGHLHINNDNEFAILCDKELKLVSGYIHVGIKVSGRISKEDIIQEKNKCLKAILAKVSICINDKLNIESEFLDGFGTPTPTTPTSPPMSGGNTSRPTTCSSAIIRQGYACCPSNCVIVYVDESGTWGIINNRWCGCKGGGDNDYTCQVSIIKQGYNCCSKDNCKIILTDETGRWGVENSQWCGIYLDCM